MTTVEALKNLYVALGGDDADLAGVNLNPQAVEKIAELMHGGVGGYDIVIKSSKALYAGAFSVADLTLEKGSYTEAIGKIKAGEPLSVQVYYANFHDDTWTIETYPVCGVYADSGYHDDIEINVSKSVSPTATVKKTDDTNGVIMGASWNTSWLKIIISESGIALG